MDKKTVWEKTKEILKLFWLNLAACMKHPIKYIKNYKKDFLASNRTERIVKVVALIVGGYLLYRIFITVLMIWFAYVFATGLVAADDPYYNLCRQRFMTRHGREPLYRDEVYNDQ